MIEKKIFVVCVMCVLINTVDVQAHSKRLECRLLHQVCNSSSTDSYCS